MTKAPVSNEHEPGGGQVLRQFCAHGVTTSWEEDLLGARASPPPQSLSQSRPSPSPGSTGCNIAGKLSGNQRDRINRTRGRCTGR